jgi:hypothetical protein
VDRAHNNQTMTTVFTPEKQRQYLDEVEKWFMPLCKAARRSFPVQFCAYENVKILLRSQRTLLQHIHAAAAATSTP